MKILVIVPAYNEIDSICEVIKTVPRSFTGASQVDVLVVDDGSTDGTAARVQAETDAGIVSHTQNKGVGAAFQTGVRYALENRADMMVWLDADGQFDPCDIPKLLEPILKGEADFVAGSRFIDQALTPQMPKVKLWGNKRMAKLISWLVGSKFYDVSCGFRAYNKEALLNLNLFGRFTYTQEVFLDLGFKELRIKEVPVRVKYFPERESRVFRGIFHYGLNALKIISRTLRDYRPLKFFGTLGLTIFALGSLFEFLLLGYFLETGNFSPYKFVGAAGGLLNIIGLLILILALVADMLYRMRMNQEKILYYQKRKQYYP